MNDLELDNEINKIADQIIENSTITSLKEMISKGLRLFYSMGHRYGYNEAMDDKARHKDKRVVAHLNSV